jgi:polyhydroxyalkanoate synthesis regulator phasin
MLAGLGALDLTEDKLRAAFDELVQRGEVSEKDARDLVATWTKRATERRDAINRQVRELVKEELKLAEVTREEFDALAEIVGRLERRMGSPEDGPVRR